VVIPWFLLWCWFVVGVALLSSSPAAGVWWWVGVARVAAVRWFVQGSTYARAAWRARVPASLRSTLGCIWVLLLPPPLLLLPSQGQRERGSAAG
jgi:hypothetical protein